MKTDHPFFKSIEIEALSVANFDARLAENFSRLVGVFFWGHRCPNCEVAKNTLAGQTARLNALEFKWFHVNVYENSDLGTRFTLHGIPTFLFFEKGKKLGRISPFPGADPFFETLEKLKNRPERK